MICVSYSDNGGSMALLPASFAIAKSWLRSRFQKALQSCAFLFYAARLSHSGLEPFFPPLAPALDFSLTFCCHLVSLQTIPN
jgi:hypothetical protein